MRDSNERSTLYEGVVTTPRIEITYGNGDGPVDTREIGGINIEALDARGAKLFEDFEQIAGMPRETITISGYFDPPPGFILLGFKPGKRFILGGRDTGCRVGENPNPHEVSLKVEDVRAWRRAFRPQAWRRAQTLARDPHHRSRGQRKHRRMQAR